MNIVLIITIVAVLSSGEEDVRRKEVKMSSMANCINIKKGLDKHYAKNDVKKTGYRSITIECKPAQDLTRM